MPFLLLLCLLLARNYGVTIHCIFVMLQRRPFDDHNYANRRQHSECKRDQRQQYVTQTLGFDAQRPGLQGTQ